MMMKWKKLTIRRKAKLVYLNRGEKIVYINNLNAVRWKIIVVDRIGTIREILLVERENRLLLDTIKSAEWN